MQEFCVDVSTYEPVVWVEEEQEVCETMFVKECEEKEQEVCADVSETRCKVGQGGALWHCGPIQLMQYGLG